MEKDEKILSFTSHKTRLPLIDSVFENHIEIAENCGMKVVFSCQDDSIPYLTDYQKGLIDSGKVELLHVAKDHGSNTKWTLCRVAHPDAVLVVVDDDWIYDVQGIRSLLEAHSRHPESVICRAYRTIPWIGDALPIYAVKPFYTYPKTVTPHVLVNRLKDNVLEEEKVLVSGTVYPEHFLGVLYPSGFPSIPPSAIPDECRKDDDVYVGSRIAAEKRGIVFAGCPRVAEDYETQQPGSLWVASRNCNGSGTYNALKSVMTDFRGSKADSPLGEVYLLTCKKYPLRRESAKKELARLGIQFVEQYDDGHCYPTVGFTHKHVNRCHIAKWLALKKFLATDNKFITIIEDDIRFLKEMGEISEALASIPKGFGACRLSWSPSPYIRSEKAASDRKLVAEIERNLARPGFFWAECPWASTDGCTIISRKVAEELFIKLHDIISIDKPQEVDNSDDLLCRVCEELGMPLLVYKPLLCIQVVSQNIEKGKSAVDKFLKSDLYHVPGIVRHLEDYAVDLRSNAFTPCAKDGFTVHRRRVVDGPLTAARRAEWNW